ncbi:MAG: histidine kinase dimerization/phospho-acceptor domain-containing protein, partial [Oleibacter sp.]|nr:histidine kinase dimerization/phospho-acceptor domain-containing protein [Thalassolituus sp.]
MKDWSINKRILFLTLMPSILMSLVLGIYFISGRSSDLDKLLADRGLSMAKQLAPTCEYGLMTGNIGILQNIANTMLEEQDVRSINIYDADLNLLTRAGPLMLNERRTLSSIHDNQMELRKTEGSLQIKSPVTAQNLSISDVVSEQFFNNTSEPKALLGWVEIELSNTNTRLALYQYFANAIVVISLILLSCTLIALRIGRRITRPINVMMTALEDIREGKLESRVHVAESSELKELASGINSIAASMQHTNMEYQKNIEQVARENQETIDELEIRNHQLTSGKKEAMKANRMKSEFLANVSHEIRTPLNGIIGFSDLLARTQISERQSDYLQNILKSSKDLLSIINDILDLSKIDANKLILENIS